MDGMRIVDISMTLKEPMRGFKKSIAKSIKKDGWNASTLEIYSHAGTHMDAPLHFDVNPGSIDKIPVERLVCMCHMVRLVPVEDQLLITLQHLGKVADSMKAGEGIIFHTGWSHFADNPSKYRDKLPRISVALAKWLVEKKVNLIGVEPPSIADVNNLKELQEVHRILLEGDIIIVEGLCKLEEVCSDFVQLITLPLKIEGGDGAPVRAIVIEH